MYNLDFIARKLSHDMDENLRRTRGEICPKCESENIITQYKKRKKKQLEAVLAKTCVNCGCSWEMPTLDKRRVIC